jgi:hypothetical protein
MPGIQGTFPVPQYPFMTLISFAVKGNLKQKAA